MTSEKEMKNTLSDMVSTFAEHKDIVSSIQEENKTIMVLVNSIYERVEDISKKLDFALNAGIKKPKVSAVKNIETTQPKKKKSAAKKVDAETESSGGDKLIKNIMKFFKVRYTEDQTFFDDILEENQSEAIFEENKEDLDSMKEDARIKKQSSLLYKKLTKTQKNKIREKMLDEHDAASINNDDDVEGEESD